MTGKSILLKDTSACAKQYRCDLDIYLMTVLSSSYVIIMDRSNNLTGHEKYCCWYNQCSVQTLFEVTNGTYW